MSAHAEHAIHCSCCGQELSGAALAPYVAGLEQERAAAQAKRDAEWQAIRDRPRPFADSAA
jgi:hypothetical protein